jgi:group II intron reverse transcriptase/maturase
MNERGKSDRPIVPEKPSNKESGAPSSAEEVEGRGLAKGNSGEQNRDRALDRGNLQSALTRIRQAAQKDKKLRFTTLWHHVYDVRRLREAFLSMKKKAAAGVDGVTWHQYNENREENLLDLSERLKRGAYRAKPVRRKFIPKADGRLRPLGIPALEDKLVQGVTAEVLNAIYEEDFLGFSYGFRPGRGPHNALDAVSVGLIRKKVSFVFDADIRGFYDAVDHEWLVKFVEHRIGDERVVRHIKKWLNAGVLEDGKRMNTTVGTPQGSSVSPVLANIYLHYAFDLWADQWRGKKARGEVIIVRYADDILMGFQYRDDAENFRRDLEERLARFKLELHPDKTRLLEFGRFAAENREKRGEGKPETFDFLGFTHICGKKKNGKFAVLRKTIRKRMTAKLKEIKANLKACMHQPIPIVGKWLASVLRGHFQYYGVPRNTYSMSAFRRAVVCLWKQAISRRSQNGQITWQRMSRLAKKWLPTARIQHPYPEQRLRV